MTFDVFHLIVYDKEKHRQIEGKEVKETFKSRQEMEDWRKQLVTKACKDYKTECEIMLTFIEKPSQ
jgi:hypothetical protein